jgi:hypothetical protein
MGPTAPPSLSRRVQTPASCDSQRSSVTSIRRSLPIWPTGIVIPPGYRIQLQVRGRDYEYPPALTGDTKIGWFPLTGCGPFLHDDERDRPPDIFSAAVTLHTGGEHQAYLLVPALPTT